LITKEISLKSGIPLKDTQILLI